MACAPTGTGGSSYWRRATLSWRRKRERESRRAGHYIPRCPRRRGAVSACQQSVGTPRSYSKLPRATGRCSSGLIQRDLTCAGAARRRRYRYARPPRRRCEGSTTPYANGCAAARALHNIFSPIVIRRAGAAPPASISSHDRRCATALLFITVYILSRRVISAVL